jgi:hypothetical protein
MADGLARTVPTVFVETLADAPLARPAEVCLADVENVGPRQQLGAELVIGRRRILTP